jgi:hypothetical protein
LMMVVYIQAGMFLELDHYCCWMMTLFIYISG